MNCDSFVDTLPTYVHSEIEWGENQVVFVLGIDATVFLHVIFEIVGISCCNLEL